MEYLVWPSIALILGLAFLGLFRPQIAGFIDRTKTFKVPGIHAEGETLPQVQRQGAEIEGRLIGGHEQLGTPPNDEFLQAIDRHNHDLIVKSVPNAGHHLQWAIRLASYLSVQRDHEITYRLIFGSQLRALRQISQSGASLGLDSLREFYNEAATAEPEIYQDFDFASWWGFLAERNLVTQKGMSLEITPAGRSFLAYLAVTGIRDKAHL